MTPKVEIDTRPPANRRPNGGGGTASGVSGLSVNGVPVGSTGDRATSTPTSKWRIPANNHPGNVYRSDSSDTNGMP